MCFYFILKGELLWNNSNSVTNQLGIYYLTKEEDGHASIVPEKVVSRTFLIVAKILVGFLGRLIHAFSLNT